MARCWSLLCRYYLGFCRGKSINAILQLLIASVFGLTLLCILFSTRANGAYKPVFYAGFKVYKLPGPFSFCPTFNASLDGKNSIFFVESSGEFCLTPRQACSIESAARLNPHMMIHLYMGVGSGFDSNNQHNRNQRAKTKGNTRDCDVMKVLAKLNNIAFKYGTLVDELRGTLLHQHWYQKIQLNRSHYPHVHLSDAVRVAILQKRGGIYLDLDVVVLRPLHCLRNTAAYLPVFNSWVENGVLAFDPGHPFLQFLMKTMAAYYKPKMRESMGPPTLGLALKFYCGIPLQETLQHVRPYTCQKRHRIQLKHPDAFYAIRHYESQRFVDSPLTEDSVKRLSTSFLSHVYFHTKHKVPSNSLFASLARQYCPAVYNTFLKDDF